MQLTNELDQLSVPPTLRVLCRFLKQKMRQRQDCGHLSFDVTMTSWWRQWLWWRSIEVWKLYPNCALSSSAACVQNRTNKSIRRTREVNNNVIASKIQIPQLYVWLTVHVVDSCQRFHSAWVVALDVPPVCTVSLRHDVTVVQSAVRAHHRWRSSARYRLSQTTCTASAGRSEMSNVEMPNPVNLNADYRAEQCSVANGVDWPGL